MLNFPPMYVLRAGTADALSTSAPAITVAQVPTITLSKISDAGSVASHALGEFVLASQLGTGANQIPQLDGAGKLAQAVLPAIALTEFKGHVANQAAMVALTAEPGDWCIRDDLGDEFILSASPASTAVNWIQIVKPYSAVTSVANRTGAITLSTADVSGPGTAATANTGTNAGNVAVFGAGSLTLGTNTIQATNLTGTIALARIPSLPASQITSGVFGTALLGTGGGHATDFLNGAGAFAAPTLAGAVAAGSSAGDNPIDHVYTLSVGENMNAAITAFTVRGTGLFYNNSGLIPLGALSANEAGSSSYLSGTPLAYELHPYRSVLGQRYYATYHADAALTISTDGVGVDLSWNAPASGPAPSGYVLVLGSTAIDVGNVTSHHDDGTGWGSIPAGISVTQLSVQLRNGSVIADRDISAATFTLGGTTIASWPGGGGGSSQWTNTTGAIYYDAGNVLLGRSADDGSSARFQIKEQAGVNGYVASFYDGADTAYLKMFIGYSSPSIQFYAYPSGSYTLGSFQNFVFTAANGGSFGFLFQDQGANPWMYVTVGATMIGTATDDGSGAKLQVAGDATFTGKVKPGSINTATTAGTSDGQIVYDSSGGANTGHFWGWYSSAWHRLDN